MHRLIWLMLPFVLFFTACENAQETPVQTGPPPRAAAPPENAEAAPETTYPGVDMELGERVYKQSCTTCHAEGIAGAPRQGDREEWRPRIAKGMETLVRHSIEGFQGNRGVMPPRGGNSGLTDQEVASAVAYMVQMNR